MIGTNKKDSQDTVDNMLADLEAGKIPEPRRRRPAIERCWRSAARARQLRTAGRRSTRPEVAGEPLGRPRVKFCDVEEMVEASAADRSG